MDIRKLHERFKDKDSPSPELQIRWLKRLGFEPHIIDQAMLNTYTDIDRGIRNFKSGSELNAYIRDMAIKVRDEELAAYINKLEQFEAKLKAKWEAERAEREAQAAKVEAERQAREKEIADAVAAATIGLKKPWYKRAFSRKVKE